MTNHDVAGRTLRLRVPQWQAAGGDRGYILGTQLLELLAPPTPGAIEASVPVDMSDDGLESVGGIYAHGRVLEQLTATRAVVEEHQPDRVVVLGGDCSVDVAPFDYLNDRYDGDVAVVWFDAHADLSTPTDWPYFHAAALRVLLGEYEPEFTAALRRPVRRDQVVYVGLRAGVTSQVEATNGTVPSMPNVTPAQLAAGPGALLERLRAVGRGRVVVHFDVDVLDPSRFSSMIGPEPGGVTPEAAVEALAAVAAEFDVVGLGIAEYVPRDAQTLQRMLAQMPLLGP